MNNVSSAQLPKKMDPEEYDLVILGGGTGSTIAAWTFAGQGLRVAAIDRKYVGGSCPNIACLPSKNIIHSAKVASYFRRSDEFGIARKDFTVDDFRVVHDSITGGKRVTTGRLVPFCLFTDPELAY
jgi:pyruvate/2-oxoglutarate dehydrogenase complex dihydrolipoamide dehydrogenase (E3) component